MEELQHAINLFRVRVQKTRNNLKYGEHESYLTTQLTFTCFKSKIETLKKV